MRCFGSRRPRWRAPPIWTPSMGHLKAQMLQPLQVALEMTGLLSVLKPTKMNVYSFTSKTVSNDPCTIATYRSNAIAIRILIVQIKHAWAGRGFSTFLMLTLDRAILPLIKRRVSPMARFTSTLKTRTTFWFSSTSTRPVRFLSDSGMRFVSR